MQRMETLTSEEARVIDAVRDLGKTVADNEHTRRTATQRGDLDEIHRMVLTLRDKYPFDQDVSQLETQIYGLLY